MKLAQRLLIDHLRELAARGLTREEISEESGLSYSTISSMSVAHGIDIRRRKASSTPAGIARIEDMRRRYENGETLQQIGEVYNVSRERVRQILSRTFGTTARDGGHAEVVRRKRSERDNRRDARSQAVWGCSYSEYRSIVKHPDKPTYAYWSQRKNAIYRGIEWKFNLSQWWAVWRDSGHWGERGRCGSEYVMCRKGDVGPYSPDNVYIATASQNIKDYHANTAYGRANEAAA